MRHVLLALGAASALVLQNPPKPAVLTGWAVLPADTFAPGPPSGAFRPAGTRASEPPFPSQPVQGFSSIWPAGEGWYRALADNGFGSKANSPDFLLRIYRVRPLFDAKRIEVDDTFIQLRDPDRRLPFRIVNELTPDRLLTGGDLDPESIVRMPDGTFWIGDEFGPFLLHVAADGRLLAPPAEAPGVRSPDHPLAASPETRGLTAPTVGRSRGFEGLAVDTTRQRLIALLEAGCAEPICCAEPQKLPHTCAMEFDPGAGRFTGRIWRVPLEQEGLALTELVHHRGENFLTIARDDGHGPKAKYKRVLLLTLGDGDRATLQTLVDLLDIEDPQRLGGESGRFAFPFITTEAIWPVGEELLLVNDNNYPATGGRAEGRRDPTEFIRVRQTLR